MSKAYDFYRTPSQEEIEEQERLEYLEWYNQQKQQENETNSSRIFSRTIIAKGIISRTVLSYRTSQRNGKATDN